MTTSQSSFAHLWILCALAAVFSAIAGCGSTELKSHWRTRQIDIDGRNSEWQDLLTQIEDKHAMVGLANDSEYLYVSLVTDDPQLLRQATFRGLTLWFDPDGGNKKTFGIRYPLGVQPGQFGGRRPDAGRDENSDGQPRERFSMDTTEAEILGPGESDHLRVNVVGLRGISMKATSDNGVFTYELKVPLADSRSDGRGIGTSAGRKIGIGIETGARMERQATASSGRGDAPEGAGRGGRGSGFGGGRGGRRGGGNSQSGTPAEPFSVWATVQLSVADAESNH